MERLELGPGLEAELLDRARASPDMPQAPRPASRAVESEHQLAAEPLSQRILRDERLKLTDELRVTPQREIGFDAVFQAGQPELSMRSISTRAQSS